MDTHNYFRRLPWYDVFVPKAVMLKMPIFRFLNCKPEKSKVVFLEGAACIKLNFSIEFHIEGNVSALDLETLDKHRVSPLADSILKLECIEFEPPNLSQDSEPKVLQKVLELQEEIDSIKHKLAESNKQYLCRNQFEYWKDEILSLRRESSGYAGNFNSPLCYEYEDPSGDAAV